MRWAIFLTVAIGAWIGATTPARHRPAPPPTVDAVAEPGAKPVDVPVETVLERDSNGQFFAHGEVNGEPIRFIVDTGADMVALTVEDARRAHVQFDENNFMVVAKSASGVARGQDVILDNVLLDGKRVHDVRGAVVQGLDVSLLGQSYLARIGSVHMAGDEMRLK